MVLLPRSFLHIDAKEEAVIQKGFAAGSKSEIGGNNDVATIMTSSSSSDSSSLALSSVVFETDEDGYISPILNSVKIYHGSNQDCILEKGSTGTLLLLEAQNGSLALGSLLRKEDYLLFQEGDKREVVKLIKDAKEVEIPGVTDQHTAVVEVAWSENEDLVYDYNISNGAGCKGNIIPASQGMTIKSELLKIYKNIGVPVDSFDSEVTEDDFAKLEPTSLPMRPNQPYFTLTNSPLTYLSGGEKNSDDDSSGASAFSQGNKSTLQVWVDGELWTEVPSLLEMGPFDNSYAVFIDVDGLASVIFGDGINGKKPLEGSDIKVTYRIGTGSTGNIGYNVLTEFSEEFSNIIAQVTNPLPGTNGVNLESIEEAKTLAPNYIKIQDRAVTPKDYEAVAQEHKLVSRAKARFVWTGSWYTVFVNVDPKESNEVLTKKEREARVQNIQNDVNQLLMRKKMTGYDIQVIPPDYVPLRLELTVCVKQDYFATSIKVSVENALRDRINSDGSKGFFNPDNITFGQPIFISNIYKAVMDVPGVHISHY